MATNKNLKTPIIKPRLQGGTFYTFSSALEDIGLNINTNQNKVTLSHYALLNIPDFGVAGGPAGSFDTLATTEFSDVNKGDYSFAEGFENYVLNLETVLRNQNSYNFASSLTVSERCFWKWLSKSCMDFQPDPNDTTGKYFIDANSIVKCFGEISSSAQRSDDYGMYNETFVQIPSSFGQMRILYKNFEDNNMYVSDNEIHGITPTYIENINEEDFNPDDHDFLHTGISSHAIYDASTAYIIGEHDCMGLVTDINDYKSYYNEPGLTYDDMAMDDNYIIRSNFGFNAILVYYSVYDSEGNSILSTNAYGLLLLNSAKEAPTEGLYKFPELVKTKSTATASGTSYSFRLNIKTTSVYSTQIVANDNATAAYSMSTDFNDVIKNLNTAIDIISSNANLISKIYTDNTSIKALAINAIDEIEQLKPIVSKMEQGLFDYLSTPLLDASMAAINELDSSISFMTRGLTPADDIKEGFMDGSLFTYGNMKATNRIDASSVTVNGIKTSDISYGGTEMNITSPSGNTIMKVAEGGLFNNKDFFYKNRQSANTEELTTEEITELFNVIQTTYPAGHPEEHGLYIDSSTVLSTNADEVRKTLLDDGYINIPNLLAVIIEKIKRVDSFRWTEASQNQN